MRSQKDYKRAAAASQSLSDMCRFFNILPVGGNLGTMKHAIAKYGIPTDHFLSPVVLLENHGKPRKRFSIIKEDLIERRGHVCELCSLSEWKGFKIALQVDHINGDNTNNELKNLRLLCPNCHGQTPTFGLGLRENAAKICVCGLPKKSASKKCTVCINKTNYQKLTYANIKKPKFEKTLFSELAAKASSIRSLIMLLKEHYPSLSYNSVKRSLIYYAVDISHFTGQSWNKGLQSNVTKDSHKITWKRFLLSERGKRCESCSLTKWQDENIPLELEHIDGNNKNNSMENLKLLCPNCHSQTKTWKKKKSSLNVVLSQGLEPR
jgi:5-methylcytosine-specific restriction endonuclease McrA